ncbi:MAG: HIT domain-containing protein [Pseudomonadota bacterium]
MKTLTNTWTLDERLARDTLLMSEHDLWELRLVNDARWPWVMIVPKIQGACELEDLPKGMLQPMLEDATLAAKTLKAMDRPDQRKLIKTNIATIGNVVRQFHLHIVARHEGDPNWPAPIWGFETAIPYSEGEAQSFIQSFLDARTTL